MTLSFMLSELARLMICEGTYDSEIWCKHACDLRSKACAAGGDEDNLLRGGHGWLLNS
jgi:hypothetical protein